jgi:predicted regulator of Ras-like GTPase activity (Roadblock/LC7/MglB family)
MNNNERQSKAVAPASLSEILSQMNESGKFKLSVLTSIEGLPIATVPINHNSDLAAAMVALIQRASNDAQGQLGMNTVDEVTICDHDRTRLVCRHLILEKERLILAAIVPPGRPYRYVTNRAMRQIRQLLS